MECVHRKSPFGALLAPQLGFKLWDGSPRWMSIIEQTGSRDGPGSLLCARDSPFWCFCTWRHLRWKCLPVRWHQILYGPQKSHGNSPLTGVIAEDACWPFAEDRGLMIEVNCFINRMLGLHLLVGWLFQTGEYLLKFPSKYHPYQLSNKTEIEKCRFKDLSVRKTS